jgi:hypothetical protein
MPTPEQQPVLQDLEQKTEVKDAGLLRVQTPDELLKSVSAMVTGKVHIADTQADIYRQILQKTGADIAAIRTAI